MLPLPSQYSLHLHVHVDKNVTNLLNLELENSGTNIMNSTDLNMNTSQINQTFSTKVVKISVQCKHDNNFAF